jgi:hypothetical protein
MRCLPSLSFDRITVGGAHRSAGQARLAEPMARITEITIVTGERHLVRGDVKEVEQAVIGAARGSIMELAWLVEAETAAPVAINPEHVVMLRAVASN